MIDRVVLGGVAVVPIVDVGLDVGLTVEVFFEGVGVFFFPSGSALMVTAAANAGAWPETRLGDIRIKGL